MSFVLRNKWSVACIGILGMAAAACGGAQESDPVDGVDAWPDEIASYTVTGTVNDFATNAPVDAQATVTTSSLTPPPTVSVSGSSFEIQDVPPHSVFHALAGAPPTYRNTYGAAIEVLEDDVSGIALSVVSEAYLGDLVAALGADASTGGILFARAVDDQGNGRAGVAADSFEIDDAAPVSGPYFLDANMRPDPLLTETSESGWAVFFQVEAGLATVNAAADSGYTMVMSASPVAPATVTLSVVVVSDGPAVLPSNVSFSQDVVPVFEMRGCVSCHSGNGIGKDLGNLMLDGGDNKIFKETTEELSPSYGVSRVNLEDPAASLLLTMPSAEDPPDTHPNVTFFGDQDPDFLTIMVWIQEGALDN
jgi:hypothetical protein